MSLMQKFHGQQSQAWSSVLCITGVNMKNFWYSRKKNEPGSGRIDLLYVSVGTLMKMFQGSFVEFVSFSLPQHILLV